MKTKSIVLLAITGIVFLTIIGCWAVFNLASLLLDQSIEHNIFYVYFYILRNILRVIGLSCLLYYFVQLLNKYKHGKS